MFDMTPPTAPEVVDDMMLSDKELLAAEKAAERKSNLGRLRPIRLEIIARKLDRIAETEDSPWEFDMRRPLILDRNDEACGTAGCIAGLTHAHVFSRMPAKTRPTELIAAWIRGEAPSWSGLSSERRYVNWQETQKASLAYLCLPENYSGGFGNDLFDPDVCEDAGYDPLSPSDAAAACRRVARGEEAWPEVA